MEQVRSSVIVQVNRQTYHIDGRQLLFNLSRFLREKLHLNATKIVCGEGDCGACTVLLGRPRKTAKGYTMQYQVVNSCILPLFSLDAMHVITLEGLNKKHLSALQQAMVDKGGTQCGFCTAGIIMSLTDYFQQKTEVSVHNAKSIKEKLKGNLCRCTGYQPIVNAALSIQNNDDFQQDYALHSIAEELFSKQQEAVFYHDKNSLFSLWIPTNLSDALALKEKHKDAQICAGLSDLAVLWNKQRVKPNKYLSLYKITALAEIKETKKALHIDAQVSLQQLQDYLHDHKYLAQKAFYQLLNRFASPQIKNRATLIGNLANASPVGDTIPFLMVNKAKIKCQQLRSQRLVNINSFFKAYKKLALKDNEIITEIILPKLKRGKKKQECFLYKTSQRYDVDISCVSAAFFVRLSKGNKIKQIRIAFGGIAASVIRLYAVEQKMKGRILDQIVLEQAIIVALESIHPLSDIRGSDKFRRKLVENLFRTFYLELLS